LKAAFFSVQVMHGLELKKTKVK